jgi:GNAT superfamily N-acetyltransferase
MSVDATIEPLATRHLQGLLGLYAHLHSRDEASPPAAHIEALWAHIQADPAQLYLGAFVGGELVSACNATLVTNLTRGGRPYAVIENVVTHTAFRRRGIGSQVMKSLLERCWAEGCYKVMLMSAAQRPEAHRFYTSLGFDATAKQAFVISRR